MSEARVFTEKELEHMYAEQWVRYMDNHDQARKSFHELKAWLGPRIWGVFMTLPFTQEHMDHVLNVLPRAMWHPNQTPQKILATAIAASCAEWSKLDEHTKPVTKPPAPVQLERTGNVVHAAFGKRNETTDRTNL